MNDEPATTERRMFEELQELVALEMKDIIATAGEEGFSPRDVVSALELALRAEIEALAAEPDMSEDSAIRKENPVPTA